DESMDGKLLNWLSVGLEVHDMHKETDRCEFCNQKFNVTEIKEKISKQINTEYKNTLDQLDAIKNRLESSNNKLNELNSIFTKDEINYYKEEINKVYEIIEIKKENTKKSFDLTTSIDSLLSVDKLIL